MNKNNFNNNKKIADRILQSLFFTWYQLNTWLYVISLSQLFRHQIFLFFFARSLACIAFLSSLAIFTNDWRQFVSQSFRKLRRVETSIKSLNLKFKFCYIKRPREIFLEILCKLFYFCDCEKKRKKLKLRRSFVRRRVILQVKNILSVRINLIEFDWDFIAFYQLPNVVKKKKSIET